MKHTKSTRSAIGIDFDSKEFRASQLESGPDGDRVIASAVFPRMNGMSADQFPNHDELEWLGSMLARRGFIGNRIAIMPASKWCTSHVFELPPVSDADAKAQIARVEVARERKCAPDQFEIGLWDLPTRGRIQESMVSSCDRTMLNDALDRLEKVGFEPVAVDLPELALSRATNRDHHDGGIQGILHVGWDESIAVIMNDQAVVYVRRIEHGIHDAYTRLHEQFGLDEHAATRLLERMYEGNTYGCEQQVRGVWTSLVRALIQNLDIAIRYVSHTYRMAELGNVYLSGYGASNPELLMEADEVIGMPVEPLVPESINPEPNSPNGAQLSLAIGLAARFD